MSQTEQSPQPSGGGRSLVYIIVAVIILAIIYYGSTAYWAKQDQPAEAQGTHDPAATMQSESAPPPASTPAPQAGSDAGAAAPGTSSDAMAPAAGGNVPASETGAMEQNQKAMDQDAQGVTDTMAPDPNAPAAAPAQ